MKSLTLVFFLFVGIVCSSRAQISNQPEKARAIQVGIKPLKVLRFNKIDTIPEFFKRNALDSLKGWMGPSVIELRPAEIIFVVNGFIIREQSSIDAFRQKYSQSVRRSKFYNSKKGFEKFNIRSQDGIVIIKTKKNIFLDLASLCREDSLGLVEKNDSTIGLSLIRNPCFDTK